MKMRDMIRPTGLAALASRQLAVLGCLAFASAALSAQDVQFNRDIRPILLHQLGGDHKKLTFPFQRLDQRLTGLEHARVVKEILA